MASLVHQMYQPKNHNEAPKQGMTTDEMRHSLESMSQEREDQEVYLPDGEITTIPAGRSIDDATLEKIAAWEKTNLVEENIPTPKGAASKRDILKNEGWTIPVRGGKNEKDPLEWDRFILSFSDAENASIKRHEELNPGFIEKMRTIAVEEARRSTDGEKTGAKMAIVPKPHENTGNIHFHFTLHRHPIDIENKVYGKAEGKSNHFEAIIANINKRWENELGLPEKMLKGIETIKGIDSRIGYTNAEVKQEVSNKIAEAGGLSVTSENQSILKVKAPEAVEIDEYEAQLNRDSERLQAEIMRLQAEQAATIKSVVLAQKARAAVAQNIVLTEDLEKQVNINQDLMAQNQAATGQIEIMTGKIDDLLDNKLTIENQLADKTKELTDLQQEYKDLEAEKDAEILTLDSKVQSLEADNKQLDADNKALDVKNQTLEADNKTLDADNKRLDALNKTLEAENDHLNDVFEKLQKRDAEKAATLNKIEQSINANFGEFEGGILERIAAAQQDRDRARLGMQSLSAQVEEKTNVIKAKDQDISTRDQQIALMQQQMQLMREQMQQMQEMQQQMREMMQQMQLQAQQQAQQLQAQQMQQDKQQRGPDVLERGLKEVAKEGAENAISNAIEATQTAAAPAAGPTLGDLDSQLAVFKQHLKPTHGLMVDHDDSGKLTAFITYNKRTGEVHAALGDDAGIQKLVDKVEDQQRERKDRSGRDEI